MLIIAGLKDAPASGGGGRGAKAVDPVGPRIVAIGRPVPRCKASIFWWFI